MIDYLVTCLKDFSRQGHLSKAFETFSLIRLHLHSTLTKSHDQIIIIHSISTLLSSCINHKSPPEEGIQLHGHILSLGFQHHPLLVPKLVTFYANLNLLAEAHTLTKHSNVLHPLPWNVLISSYVRCGLYGEALSAYKQLVGKGIRPDNFTYPSVLKACVENFDLGFGRMVHKSIDVSRFGWSLFVHNSLVSMYGKFGEVDIARRLFDKMPERDAVSWNAMISAYASKGMCKEALELFGKMLAEGAEVNKITWNTVAGAFLHTGNYKKALQLLSQMRSCGVNLDSVATIIGLSACSCIGTIERGKEIHGSAIRNYFDGIENVRNALITMYSRCKDLSHAYVIFRLIENKSIITWNSILSGYANMDQSEEAYFIFREMTHSGIEPNYVSIASILPLCARVANLQHGKEFHCYIIRHQCLHERLLLWNALVDMYSRSGKVLEAKKLFDLMSRRDEVTYTSLIAGFGIQGEGRAALDLFDEMNRNHIRPDSVTMVAVLSACSHSGLVTEGKMLFEKLSTVYRIVPCLEHFSCMVDLYGRAGLLNKAKEIITTMPYRPTSVMWVSLLGSCLIHRNIEIGEWAAEKLLEMRPDHSGHYTLIANMYATAGCWSKLAEVRSFMRELGVRKVPGCAWIELGSESFPFFVGNTSEPIANELYLLLDRLTGLMKDAAGFGGENSGSDMMKYRRKR